MKFNRSKGISEIVAIILGVVLTLVAFGVLYAFVFSTLGRSSSSTAANVQGNIVGSAAAVNVFNTGSVEITSVTGAAGDGCTWAALSPSTINPGSSGTITGSGCTGVAGTTVTFVLTISYVNGATTSQEVSLIVN